MAKYKRSKKVLKLYSHSHLHFQTFYSSSIFTMMFQGLNQFIVLATLLSTGIGGLAIPTRRQDKPITIFSEFRGLCLDAGEGTLGSHVVLYVRTFFIFLHISHSHILFFIT
jgi:hypothetical protein